MSACDGGISEDWITANLTGVCMDEAAILGNLGTKTLEQFRRIFNGVQYKWAATATPAPNDYRQMIYFGDFFDEMDQGQALTQFFSATPTKPPTCRLCRTWSANFGCLLALALFIEKPSDIDSAYSDDGFSMPELEIIWHRLTSDHEKAWSVIDRDGQAFLLNDTTMGISNASVEKRSSMDARMAEAHTIISAQPDRNWLLWHHLEDERRMIEKMFHNASTCLRIARPRQARADLCWDFSHGHLPLLASKADIMGQGCNFQYACRCCMSVLNSQFVILSSRYTASGVMVRLASDRPHHPHRRRGLRAPGMEMENARRTHVRCEPSL